MTEAIEPTTVRRKAVFVAGASGAVGRPLCRLLLDDGWRVVGTTRSASRANDLSASGVEPVVVDVFDREALVRAVVGARPEVVVHQLTDLPRGFDAASLAAALPRTDRLREVGTENLLAAAVRAGSRRLVAQSIAFAYAPGPRPFVEESPLDPSATALVRLEELVLGGSLEGIVLRYGRFYGPGTWFDAPTGEGPVHVAAAADAARRAVTLGKTGIYNVAEEDDGTVSSRKARSDLNWDPGFRAKASSEPRDGTPAPR